MANSESPIIEWNDVRLLQALEVAPILDEDEDAEIYDVTRGGLGLTVVSRPWLGALHISLRLEPNHEPITSFVVHVGWIGYISDRRGQFLQCESCFLAADTDFVSADATAMHLAFAMQIFVKPRIEIRFV